MGVLDTATDTFEFVDEPWLAQIGGYGRLFDFVAAVAAMR